MNYVILIILLIVLCITFTNLLKLSVLYKFTMSKYMNVLKELDSIYNLCVKYIPDYHSLAKINSNTINENSERLYTLVNQLREELTGIHHDVLESKVNENDIIKIIELAKPKRQNKNKLKKAGSDFDIDNK